MKHQILLFLSIGTVFFFILLNVELPKGNGITGAAVVKSYTEEETYAMALHDAVKKFFGISRIQFPTGTCSAIAEELYGDLAYQPVNVQTGFSTTGKERIASTNFVIDRHERYGTIDFVRGAELLSNYGVNAMISINTEAVVRVPKEERANFLTMDLLGISGEFFYVQKGQFSTPSFECVFVAVNGEMICDCEAHPISGIEVAGITNVRTEVDYYEKIKTKLNNNR